MYIPLIIYKLCIRVGSRLSGGIGRCHELSTQVMLNIADSSTRLRVQHDILRPWVIGISGCIAARAPFGPSAAAAGELHTDYISKVRVHCDCHS